MLRNLALAAGAALFLPMAANAAVITDGNVSLGVLDLGNLNDDVNLGTPDVVGMTIVGERWIAPDGTQYESTSHGCLCEGWGVAVNGSSTGTANVSGGTYGLTSVSFTSTATTATSVVQLDGTDVYVTHDFALASETDNLYRVKVTIENRGTAAATDVTYRRAMDWDTSPTPFDEYVSIGGTSTTTLLKDSSDNGFATTDPLGGGIIDLAGCGISTDFSSCGPADHGAVFDFDFGTIAAGGSYSFDIYYGGAANKKDAFDALAAVKAELYSFGWSGHDPNQDGLADSSGCYGSYCFEKGARTPTFIFAFSGVGGEVVVPEPGAVPLPAAGLMLLGGLGGLGAFGAFRKRKAN